LLKFEQAGAKEWKVMVNEHELTKLQLSPSSVTNKFFIVTDFIERVAEFHGKDFSEWFVNLVKECNDEETKTAAIIGSTDTIKKYVSEYLDHLNIDYDQFVDESKAKKNSILFRGPEIDQIIRLSCYLKMYSLFSNSQYSLGKSLHKDVYNKLASDIMSTDIVSKIFDVVKTKTFRYNMSDKFMWEYIKTIQCKDIGIHIIEIFNFIMNNIIVLCEEDKNPITYFVGVVDESVKWFLRSVYKGSIVYDDSISTEDIHGINVNNLVTYSFNDTLGRLKSIAFDKIYKTLEKENSMNLDNKGDSDQYIINFHNRLSNINYISPLGASLVFPLLSKMTEITYVHFKTISAEHAAVLSYYLNNLLSKVFKTDYKNLFQLLDYYPLTSPSINTTYKIKSIHEYITSQNNMKNFYGFNTKTLPHKVLCHFIGRVSRINFCHLITGQNLSGIPLSKVETDMIHLYTLFFSGQLDDKISEMTTLMNADF
jgi:hypothetical protein